MSNYSRGFVRGITALPIKRERADKFVQAFPDRARAINSDARYLHRITRIALFGSYLTDKAVLGDLDIALDFEFKVAPSSEADRLAFEAHFPPPAYIKRDFVARLWWATIKLKRDFSPFPLTRVHHFSELAVLKCPYRLIFETELSVTDCVR